MASIIITLSGAPIKRKTNENHDTRVVCVELSAEDTLFLHCEPQSVATCKCYGSIHRQRQLEANFFIAENYMKYEFCYGVSRTPES
jgi:hypothetical protein